MFITKENLDGLNLRFVTVKDVEDKELTEREVRELEAARYEEHQIKAAKVFATRAKQVKELSDSANHNLLEKFNRYLEETSSHITALDTLFYTDHEFRAAFNALQENPKTMIDYTVTAARAGKAEYARYKKANERYSRAVEVTTANPGIANTIDTTVAQSIMWRAENIGQVLPEIAKITVPYGDYELPFYNKYSIAGYLTETGTVPDIQPDLDDATNGIKKTKWTPRDFALLFEQSFRSISKLSPAVLNQIFNFVSMALTTGMEYQAVSGPGTGQNESGMITVASAVTFNGNAYLTFVDACSAVGAKNVVNKVAFMNERAWGEFKKLRVINTAYRDAINVQKKMIDDIRVIVVPESTIPTSSNATNVVVGDPKHYLSVTSGELAEYKFDNGKVLNRQTTYHMLRDSKAIFSDSFARFPLTVA